MKILITGGCGFIGSNFINYLFTNPEVEENIEIINLDAQTYAGRGKNLEHMELSGNSNYKLIKGNICNKLLVDKLFLEYLPELVINFAAESHVDRSIESDIPFVRTNILGTHNLMEVSFKNRIKRFVQISTDEVYGSLEKDSSTSTEESPLMPRSPYSATKASAELLTKAYFHTHGLPVVVTRSSNNFGPYQFPEKLLPLFITNLIDGKKVPLMWSEENPGQNVRDWLHVNENCRAIWFAAQYGLEGEIYNISGENERTNFEMTRILLNEFKVGEEMIQKISHRKGHDFRYSIDRSKLINLGFEPNQTSLEEETSKLCKWYRENQDWWRKLK